ncbi:MAG TPA: aromatic amino acid lyase [Streptosporangiaceae bacterium]|jgi:histidine ammonia-lyase
MTVVVNRRSDLTLDSYRRVALESEDVTIGPVAREAMTAARAGFTALLDSDRAAVIYGVTTRPGVEVSTPIPAGRQRGYARAALAESPHGFGGGWHDEEVIRGVVFARLADLVEGHAKVRPEVAVRVAGLLRAPMPPVPLDGQAGPGEVLPMLQIMRAVADLDLEEGEGMGLINGSPYSSAVLADAAIRARNRLRHAERIFALSIDAFRAPLDAYDEEFGGLWGDEHQAAALASIRGHLDGTDAAGRLPHQAPVSFRVVPRLLGEARRAVAGAERAAAIALRSVSVNPVYLPPDPAHPLGRVVSNGGFHNAMACPVLQSLSSAWAELALLAERQVAAFHRGSTYQLPPLLSPAGFQDDAPGGATNLFGWSVTGYVESARAAAAPTLTPAVVADTQNDVCTATALAHRKQRQAADALDGALAILAVVASQALFVTGREPAPGLAGLAAGVRSVFPPVNRALRRDQGAEAGQLAEVIAAGARTGRLDFPAAARGRTEAGAAGGEAG